MRDRSEELDSNTEYMFQIKEWEISQPCIRNSLKTIREFGCREYTEYCISVNRVGPKYLSLDTTHSSTRAGSSDISL